MQLWLLLTLLITLIFCTHSDIRSRTVPHIYWLPYLILACIPTIHVWITIGFIFPMLITIAGIILLYWAGHKYGRGADAVALIFITLTIPVVANIPTLLLIGPVAVLVAAALSRIPAVCREWERRDIPFLLPITLSTILIVPAIILL